MNAPVDRFRTLALAAVRSPARRSLALALLAVLALGGLASAPEASSSAVSLDTATAATATWLTRLNAWRATAGVSSLTENATWSAGDYAHAVYMVKNDLVTHYETPGVPYYSVAGDTAARDGNLNVNSTTSETDSQAIDWWMQAPFHAMGLMDPRLRSTGFGSYRQVKAGWQMGAAVDTVRGNSFTGGAYPVYFPGNGSIEPLTRHTGGEWPNPLQACSGYAAPTGLPVFVMVGANVATKAGAVHTFTGNGVALAHCVIDSSNAALGSYLTQRGGVIVIPKAPLTTGVKYVVSLTVNGKPYTWSFSVGALNAFNPLACTSVTATATPSSPALAGTPVKITPTVVGCPNPLYRIVVTPPGGVAAVVHDYSATVPIIWTAPITPGQYRIEVDARDATSTIPYDTRMAFNYMVKGCSSAGLAAGPASPQSPGATITFTATSTGCTTPQYEFFIHARGGALIAKTPYGGATFAWNTTGLAPGFYGVEVWVRSTGSTAAHDSNWLGTYTLTLPVCTGVDASTLAPSPVTPGASVIWTGSASGCNNAEYRWYVLPPGGAWTPTRGYGSANWTWDTTGLPSGTYQISVAARQIGSANAYNVYNHTTIVLGAPGTCVAKITPQVASPQLPGTSISVVGGSTNCTTPSYQFSLLPPGGAWTAKQPWSTKTTWNWVTTGMPAGTYELGVWVKQAGSSNRYDAYAITVFTLSFIPCTPATLSPSAASPQVPGTSVTFTATTSGCTAPLYQFWVLVPGSTTWVIKAAYSATNTYPWDTTGPAGQYRWSVWVKRNGSAKSYDTYAQTTFWVGT